MRSHKKLLAVKRKTSDRSSFLDPLENLPRRRRSLDNKKDRPELQVVKFPKISVLFYLF